MPRTRQRLSVSRLSAVEGFGVGLENAPDPVGIVGELGKCFDGEGEGSIVLVTNAVPAEHDGLQERQIAFLAEAAELLAAQPFEGHIEGAGIEEAAVARLLDRYGPLEGFDLLTDERHKLRSCKL